MMALTPGNDSTHWALHPLEASALHACPYGMDSDDSVRPSAMYISYMVNVKEIVIRLYGKL